MNTFEKQFENLDVQTAVMDEAMNKQAALSTPPDQVTNLLQQIADEHHLEVQLEMPQAGRTAPAPAVKQDAKEDELQARLNALKGL
jgi:charged multivesicular body protein 1